MRRLVIGISTVVLIGGLGAAIARPGPQNMLCPSCHGLERIAPQFYVGPSMGKPERGAIAAEIMQVRSHFGERSRHARRIGWRLAFGRPPQGYGSSSGTVSSDWRGSL